MARKADVERYNGWANYETWNVTLWVGNEEWMYRRMQAEQAQGPFTAKSAEAFARRLMPDGTPDMRSAAGYRRVDWQGVADAWNER